MTSTEKISILLSQKHAISAALKAEMAKQPFLDAFDTPNGALASVLVNHFANASWEEQVLEADVRLITKEAQHISGIPKAVWMLQYKAAVAMIKSFELIPEGGDDHA